MSIYIYRLCVRVGLFFIPRDELFKVAKSILGDDAKLPEGKAILSRIKSGGAEPEANAGVVLLNAAGKPIKAPEAKTMMSLDEFRSLRKELSLRLAVVMMCCLTLSMSAT